MHERKPGQEINPQILGWQIEVLNWMSLGGYTFAFFGMANACSHISKGHHSAAMIDAAVIFTAVVVGAYSEAYARKFEGIVEDDRDKWKALDAYRRSQDQSPTV